MDTGKDITETDTDTPTAQPSEGVKTDEETRAATSQASPTDEVEVFVEEDDDDHKKSTMSQEQTRAAWLKEKRKRQEKTRLIEEEKKRVESLQREVEDLKSTVGQMAKGAPPTLEACGFDEAVFQQKTQEYYTGSQVTPKPQAPAPQQRASNDEANFFLYQKEQELIKVMPDYPTAKAGVEEFLAANGVTNTDQVFEELSAIAMQKDIDIAKATVAMQKDPKIVMDLANSGANQIRIADILERAAGKVKTRVKKPIDSEPEPSISNKGPIDHSAAQVEKLRQKWVDNPNANNFKAYNAAKRKAKGD